MFDDTIYNHRLFKGINKTELDNLLNCLDYKLREYDRQKTVFNEGQVIQEIGIVITGSLHLCTYDFYGNRQIITDIKKGEMFAESFAASSNALPFEITAKDNSSIIFLKLSRLYSLCKNVCSYHTLLINNLVGIIAEKNINLTQKIRHITAKNVREKVLSYLNSVSKQAKSKYFDIPFNRQELADYLSVERSNLSYELCKLRDSGLIEFEKNHFKIK